MSEFNKIFDFEYPTAEIEIEAEGEIEAPDEKIEAPLGRAAERSDRAEPVFESEPGLVSYKTSDTRTAEAQKSCILERVPARLKRMQRNVRESSRLLQEEIQETVGGFRYWAVFVTLTYAPEHDWQPCHISNYVKTLREHLRRQNIRARYVWVMELTKSGKPHYHLVIWLPHGKKIPKPDTSGWWPWGHSNVQLARSPVGYLTKYASKGTALKDDQHSPMIPSGARLSGNGGLSKDSRCIRSWRLCPAWVREIFSVEDRPVRALGGGWLSRLTGVFQPSRWRIKSRALDWSWIEFEEVFV